MKNWSEQRVLVTGGAGFIGSALVWGLNTRGCDRVVVCDRFGRDVKWRNLTPLRFEDYVDADDLMVRLQNGALGNFDSVFHLGACSSTTESDAAYLLRNNYEYTKLLAAWSLEKDARFVYASSAATYGDGGAGMSDTGSLESLRPLNMYGYSKHLFDLYAARLGWHKCTIGLKYFNVFGPNEDHKGEMRSVVHKSFAQVREHGVIRLFKSYRQEYADGEQKRDFLYVKDAIEMTLHLAASKSACGLYNIGSGEANSWNKLARTVFSALGMSPRVEYIEMPETFRDKYQYYTCADLTRLRAAGFNCPTHSLEAAVTDYLQNYLVADRRLGDGEGRLAKV